MHISQFRAAYGQTPARLALIQLLESELQAIQAQGWMFSAFVFGSLVNTAKATPGDIDVLVCVSKPFGGCAWRPLLQVPQLQVMPHTVTAVFTPAQPALMQQLLPCKPVADMVRLFNADANNLAAGIAITVQDCVEVTL